LNDVIALHVTDVDDDGDGDFIAASAENKIVWYENTDGKGKFTSQRLVTSVADHPRSVIAEDLDGDGDVDVVSASSDDGMIAWYENADGKGLFRTQKIIANRVRFAYPLDAGDIDRDRDIDVAAGLCWQNRLV
jgi:hypothetical protein